VFEILDCLNGLEQGDTGRDMFALMLKSLENEDKRIHVRTKKKYIMGTI
jgi:hypothetical protein